MRSWLAAYMAMPRFAVGDRPSTMGALVTSIGALLLTVAKSAALSIIELPPAVTRMLPPINLGAIIVPPDHPDARPWPHGMVIAPAPIDDAINVAPRVGLTEVLAAALAMLVSPAASTTPASTES
jgi:hypothetical protein